jgi:peptide/nickel transport system substrate-binding protein
LPGYATENKLHVQLGFFGWIPDFAAPSGFIPPGFSCASYSPEGSNNNRAEFCDPKIDREMTRAEALHTADPVTANRLWSSIDRQITDQAPWVPFANGVVLEVKSQRVGNYQDNPEWGTLSTSSGFASSSHAASARPPLARL